MVTLWPDDELIQKRLKPDSDFDVLVEVEPTDEMKKYFKGIYGPKTELHHIPLIWSSIKSNFDLKNVYFTLKASHVYFHRVHFEKTIYDLFLMSSKGCQIIEPLFYDLYDFWKNKFGEPWRADFTKESADFFDDAVSRENVHDQLHNACADPELGQPAFKFLQEPNQTTVWVCPNKFKEVDEYIRRRVVIEEAQTLALERDILTGKINNKIIAYQKWVKALIHRLAPLWMTIYIINNLNYFLTYKEDYGNIEYEYQRQIAIN